MAIIEIDVTNKVARLRNPMVFAVCGNSDYTVRFNFDEEWDAYEAKTARFTFGGRAYDVPFTGNEVKMPVVMNSLVLKVGVYADNLVTTDPAYIGMRKSILCGGDFHENPTPDVYNELMALMNEILTIKGGNGLVTFVNGKTGDVTLCCDDIGAAEKMTERETLELLTECGVIDPVSDSTGALFTDENGMIYVL